MEFLTYEVGLNIGIELMREDIPVEKPKKTHYICYTILALVCIDLYFIFFECGYVEN